MNKRQMLASLDSDEQRVFAKQMLRKIPATVYMRGFGATKEDLATVLELRLEHVADNAREFAPA